ncbi:MAG: lamin tail domain-containing protein, partial [bacterium]|nr:lamin tail domain-containing protein [bacterium]
MKRGAVFLYPLLVVAIFLFLGISPERARAGIVINEVMYNPADGEAAADDQGEFIELYNNGSDTDIANWTFTNKGNKTDTIVSWKSRMGNEFGEGTTSDTTVIPFGKYGVILDPEYLSWNGYSIPAGTIILTVSYDRGDSELGDNCLINSG